MADKSPASQASGRPRTRQRVHKPPPALEVPDIDEDASERKRVLNVLAQRRYREKKRQRRFKESNQNKSAKGKEADEQIVIAAAGDDGAENDIEEISPSNQHANAEDLARIDLNIYNWDPLNDSSLPSALPSALPEAAGIIPDFLTAEETGDETFGGFSSESLSEMLAANSGSPSTFGNTSNSSSDMSFADSYLLPVHELTLFRAMFRIANRIGCKDQAWDLGAVSPFNQGRGTPAEQLPESWQPTASQLLVPHHPLLDILPWPGVRDRVIRIFSLPDAMRPPNATGPLALVNFAYDFEDNSEGVRIYGGDPYDPNSWEVGQVFFERWWFLFDRDIIENSNRWRQLRGAPPLALTGSQ